MFSHQSAPTTQTSLSQVHLPVVRYRQPTKEKEEEADSKVEGEGGRRSGSTNKKERISPKQGLFLRPISTSPWTCAAFGVQNRNEQP